MNVPGIALHTNTFQEIGMDGANHSYLSPAIHHSTYR